MTKEQYAAYLTTPWWRAVRVWAIRRAKHRCQHPGCTARHGLEVHHLSYKHLGDERSYELRVLCAACHQRAHDRVPLPRERQIARTDGLEHVSSILVRVLDRIPSSPRVA